MLPLFKASIKRSIRDVTTMAGHPPRAPMIIVLGATGTGKSKLAIRLAKTHNGEIINADAVQMYHGLPIVTNKVTESERLGIPHHLLGCIGLHECPWTVHQFLEETDRIVKSIRSRGKIPIVVGGTTYYVFSLLLKGGILGREEETTDRGDDFDPRCEDDPNEETNAVTVSSAATMPGSKVDLSILESDTDTILAKLRELDPSMAERWHPKDRRKIQRSLEICLTTDRKASDVYDEQHTNTLAAGAPTLRYDPLVFWIDAKHTVLKERLDKRVDTMVKEGLLEEVKEMKKFMNNVKRSGGKLDEGKGIWIAIGYKELSRWLDAQERKQGFENDSNEIRESLEEGIEAIKIGTRQYAKRQHRWIRIRLAQNLKAANALDRLFLLDGTDLDRWDMMVAEPSESILNRYLSGDELPDNKSLSNLAAQIFEAIEGQEKVPVRQNHVCETCQKTLMTEQDWEKHLKSNRHKKILDGIRKKTHWELVRTLKLRQQEATSES